MTRERNILQEVLLLAKKYSLHFYCEFPFCKSFKPLLVNNEILPYKQLKTVHTYHYKQCIFIFPFPDRKYRIDFHTFLQILLYNSS